MGLRRGVGDARAIVGISQVLVIAGAIYTLVALKKCVSAIVTIGLSVLILYYLYGREASRVLSLISRGGDPTPTPAAGWRRRALPGGAGQVVVDLVVAGCPEVDEAAAHLVDVGPVERRLPPAAPSGK